MTIFIWLALGAAIGAGASWVLSLDTRFRWAVNLVVGMAGAVGGGVLENHGRIAATPWEVTGLIVAASGAIVFLGIVNLFRRSAVH